MSKVSTQSDNTEALARKIAMQVRQRRQAGEIVSDSEVLAEHPDLHEPLKIQLNRIQQLENARVQVDEADEIEGTCDLDKTEFQLDSEEDSVDELRITLREPAAALDPYSTAMIGDTTLGESKLPSKVPPYRPTIRAPMAVIQLFHDGCTTFNPYPMLTDRFQIGRVSGDLVVPHDFWISGKHAEIQRRRRGEKFHWFLVDLKSTNGTFVRTDVATLKHNDELFIGQERYRFQSNDKGAGLLHVTKDVGDSWTFKNDMEIIGTKKPCGLPVFADDPYLEQIHAQLKRDSKGTWTITDNDSRNGVWYRIQKVELSDNAEFQLGEQRFGFSTRAAQ